MQSRLEVRSLHTPSAQSVTPKGRLRHAAHLIKPTHLLQWQLPGAVELDQLRHEVARYRVAFNAAHYARAVRDMLVQLDGQLVRGPAAGAKRDQQAARRESREGGADERDMG